MQVQKIEPKQPSLLFCLVMDAIGCASYIFPALTEVIDIIWAPVSAFIFYKTFGGKLGKFGAIVNFVEELVPFTDIIPSFTIAWFINKYYPPANR